LNYLAHGYRFVDRPWALVGTAVPDLMTVADRRRRLRRQDVPAPPEGMDRASADLAEGLHAHFHDDSWFHATPAFTEVTETLAVILRQASGAQRIRASTLGHIGMEMLLDAELMRRDPALLRAYTLAFDRVDPNGVAERVGRWARRPPLVLHRVMRFVRGASFLGSYADDHGFVLRLGQVARRARLGPLPETLTDEVPGMRALVRERADDLLTEPPPS
jgi:hypothetical protein